MDWFVAASPPKLGATVTVEADGVVEVRSLRVGTVAGSLRILQTARPFVVHDAAASRAVAPEWLARARDAMARPLFEYQVVGAGWMAAQIACGRGALLGDDPGVGKTTQAIAAIVAARALPAIIVCPASLKLNWVREIRLAKRAHSILVLSGKRGAFPRAEFTIVNYELLRAREMQLLSIGARVVVFDEAHMCKAPYPREGHRAAVATRIAHRVGSALGLTGTPMENRPAEMWRLLHIVDPRSWPRFEDFNRRYCKAPEDDDGDGEHRNVVTSHGRVERLDELQVRVQSVMLRRLKDEVLKDLPPKSWRSVLVALDDFAMKEYRLAERDVVAWLRERGREARARASERAQALTKLTNLRLLAAIGKLRTAVPEYLTQWFDRRRVEPLVIFAYHRAVLYDLVRICQHMGLRITTSLGSDSQKDRQASVDAFQSGHADVFIASVRVAGLGITLHRASDSLFVERLWTPTHMTQAADRLHRVGQTRPVTATCLDAAGTIDEYIAGVMDAKQALISRAVDDRDAETHETIETIDAVMEMFRQAQGPANDTSAPVEDEHEQAREADAVGEGEQDGEP
jgi:SNF2 family DNA or RNA helicase